MRIVGLHLRAYGHFTDCSLDFGAKPGLHLVYGDNEAGKSTSLRALSSVLFGYPSHVIDGFKYDAKDITIGADLIAQDGRTLSYVRKRRGKNALANADGTILDEATVASFLGGISKDISAVAADRDLVGLGVDAGDIRQVIRDIKPIVRRNRRIEIFQRRFIVRRLVRELDQGLLARQRLHEGGTLKACGQSR